MATLHVRSAEMADASVATFSVKTQQWHDLYMGHSLGSVFISPDGARVAFTDQVGQGERALNVVETSTGKQVAIRVPSPVSATNYASWDPSGNKLTFEVGDIPNSIYVADINAGTIAKVGEGRNPSWSPSGQYIAYYDAEGKRLLIVGPDGNNRSELINLSKHNAKIYRFDWPPIWSPDSKKLILDEIFDSGPATLWSYDLQSHRIKKLGNGTPVMAWAESK